MVNENSVCVGLARVGSDTQTIRVSTLAKMASIDLGVPLHSLIIVGELHPMECAVLKEFADDSDCALLEL